MSSINNVYDAWPSKPNLPAAVVTPADPYITTGTTYGTHNINFTVLLFTEYSASNKVVNESLDSMIVSVLDALSDSEYVIDEVEAPGPFQVSGGQYLGTAFTVTTNI